MKKFEYLNGLVIVRKDSDSPKSARCVCCYIDSGNEDQQANVFAYLEYANGYKAYSNVCTDHFNQLQNAVPHIEIVDMGDDQELMEMNDLHTEMVTAAADAVDMSQTLTVKEAASELGVSERRVVAMLSRSILNGRKRSDVWFISASEVRDLAGKIRKAGRPRKS